MLADGHPVVGVVASPVSTENSYNSVEADAPSQMTIDVSQIVLALLGSGLGKRMVERYRRDAVTAAFRHQDGQ